MARSLMTCPNCEGRIPLGRVFCDRCGAKLDLSGLSRDMIPVQRKPWIPTVLKIVAAAIVLAIVTSALLALWPRREPIGKAGTRLGARRAESQLDTANRLGAGQSLTVWLSEEDVNGYLEFFGDSKLGLQWLRVRTRPGYFEVRSLKQLDPVEIGPLRVVVTLTLDLACVPVGNRILPRRGSLGHLRLPGFALRRLAGGLGERFDSFTEKKTVASASGIAVQEGRFEISFSR
jgi:hypothetical protein